MLYKHIIQVQNKNVGLKVCVWGGGGGTNIPLPPIKKVGGVRAPLPPPSRSHASDIYIYIYIYIISHFRYYSFLPSTSTTKLVYNPTRVMTQTLQNCLPCRICVVLFVHGLPVPSFSVQSPPGPNRGKSSEG